MFIRLEHSLENMFGLWLFVLSIMERFLDCDAVGDEVDGVLAHFSVSIDLYDCGFSLAELLRIGILAEEVDQSILDLLLTGLRRRVVTET